MDIWTSGHPDIDWVIGSLIAESVADNDRKILADNDPILAINDPILAIK
jgi:hypothetical protein